MRHKADALTSGDVTPMKQRYVPPPACSDPGSGCPRPPPRCAPRAPVPSTPTAVGPPDAPSPAGSRRAMGAVAERRCGGLSQKHIARPRRRATLCSLPRSLRGAQPPACLRPTLLENGQSKLQCGCGQHHSRTPGGAGARRVGHSLPRAFHPPPPPRAFAPRAGVPQAGCEPGALPPRFTGKEHAGSARAERTKPNQDCFFQLRRCSTSQFRMQAA